MWSDNDIDNAFQRLNPPEPEPAPFPLDAWLRLETQLDKAVIERAVRRRVWRLFAAEVAVVMLAAVVWLLWPARSVVSPKAPAATQAQARPAAPGTTLERLRPAPAAIAAPKAATAAPAVISAPKAQTESIESAAGNATLETSSATSSSAKSVATPAARPLVALASAGARLGHTRRFQAAQEATPMHGAATTGALAAAPSSRKITGRPGREYGYASRAMSPLSFEKHFATATKSQPNTVAQQGVAAASAEPGVVSARHTTAQRTHSAAQVPHTLAAAAPGSSLAAGPVAIAQETTLTSSAAGVEALLAPRTALLAPIATAELPTPLTTVAVAAAPLPETPKPTRQPRLYVGIVAGPDVTTVKFAGVESPLPNVGLTVEYRISGRLRVSTGLLRSTKQYVARRADYDFGDYGSYLNHRYFDKVDGTCTVLDVPLNLRYDFLSRPHYQLYGSTGLSSFFMQREQYSYSYVEYNRPGYWSGESANANQHLFSILNLSMGYARTLSTHWSLQAEPYVKVPLAGVGAGKIKLTSAGIFFGVKYGF